MSQDFDTLEELVTAIQALPGFLPPLTNQGQVDMNASETGFRAFSRYTYN